MCLQTHASVYDYIKPSQMLHIITLHFHRKSVDVEGSRSSTSSTFLFFTIKNKIESILSLISLQIHFIIYMQCHVSNNSPTYTAAFHVPSVWLQDLVLKRRPAQGLLVDPNRLIHKQQTSALIHLYNIGAKVGAEHANKPSYNLNIIAKMRTYRVLPILMLVQAVSLREHHATCPPHLIKHTTSVLYAKYIKSMKL